MALLVVYTTNAYVYARSTRLAYDILQGDAGDGTHPLSEAVTSEALVLMIGSPISFSLFFSFTLLLYLHFCADYSYFLIQVAARGAFLIVFLDHLNAISVEDAPFSCALLLLAKKFVYMCWLCVPVIPFLMRFNFFVGGGGLQDHFSNFTARRTRPSVPLEVRNIVCEVNPQPVRSSHSGRTRKHFLIINTIVCLNSVVSYRFFIL